MASYAGRARGALRRASTAIGGVVLAGGTFATVVHYSARRKALSLPEEFILDFDLQESQLVEQSAGSFAARLKGGPSQVQVRDLVKVLDEAGKDPRVKGLVATLPDAIGNTLGGLAQVQEVRSAVCRFRLNSVERAPSCMVYADSYGGTPALYLASAFQDILVQPTGLVMCTGLVSQVPFFRGLLDKWKIVPLSHCREEYKNMNNVFTEKGFNRAHKEATLSLLRSISDQIFEGLASSRGLSLRAVRYAVDNAPHSAAQAEKLGLVTRAAYRDEVHKMATETDKRTSRAPLKRVSYKRYLKAIETKKAIAEHKQTVGHQHHYHHHYPHGLPKPGESEESPQGDGEDAKKASGEAPSWGREWAEHWHSQGLDAWWESLLRHWNGEAEPEDYAPFPRPPPCPQVAVFYGLGPIIGGRGGGEGLGGSSQIHSTKVCEELTRLRKDPATRAVVLRLDTPGGTVMASEAIRREVELLREAGKPVVVSMGNVSASGGYWISSAADKIVAQPGTITGSIGVTMLKFNVAGLLEDQGVRVETIKVGKNADAMSLVNGYTSAQEKLINRLLDEMYGDFVERVATGRGIPPAKAKRLAKGRVYSGVEAKALGLVDELGGLEDAKRLARELAGLPEDVKTVTLPANPSTAEALRQLSGGDASLAQSIAQAWASLTTESLLSRLAAKVFGTNAAAVAVVGQNQGPLALAVGLPDHSP